MALVKVHFRQCQQKAQALGGSDEHMHARLVFDISVDGRPMGSYSTEIKQLVGSKYGAAADIEVGAPVGYHGPFNHDAFREAAAKLYGRVVGSGGAIVSSTGCGMVLMMDNTFGLNETVEFEAKAGSEVW